MKAIPNIPVYWREFWRSEEKRLSMEVENCPAGSTRQLVASVFHLSASRMCRRILEFDTAMALSPWPFYLAQASSIAPEVGLCASTTA